MNGGIPQGHQLVIHLEQGDGDAGHVEGGAVGADQVAHQMDARLLAQGREATIDTVEL